MASLGEAFFIAVSPGSLGQRLCVWYPPDGGQAPASLVVHVHGFAEEMNKSRRMTALQARALAGAGHAVLQMDLLGCGDSAGDFGDATWQDWIDNVVASAQLAGDRFAASWPHARCPELWLWGHRAGCLLACAAAPRISAPCNLLLWQPTPSGKTVLQQFLRLESAAELIGKARTSPPRARESLQVGEKAVVAGYVLHPKLASGLEAARLEVLDSAGRIAWLEISAADTTEQSPVTRANLATLATRARTVLYHRIRGPSFWQTTEIETAPGLIAATLEALEPA